MYVRPEVRTDVALFASALLLQRFVLPYGQTFLGFDLIATAAILSYQFLRGKLLIPYDRLMWLVAVGLAATCSLVLNPERASLTGYAQFLFLCSLFTLTRRSTPEAYEGTLRAFQFVVALLACLAVAQFVAQFVVSGSKLIMFFGIVPSIFLAEAHTIHPIAGSSLLRSNGIFLAEPSNLTQVMAIGILIEVLEFRRPRYLAVMVLGLLLAYTGAGLVTLAVFLPLASLRHGKVALSVMLAVTFAVGLVAAGLIDQSLFLSRTSELETPGTSGFQRFVGPFWTVAEFYDTEPLQSLLAGTGPGSVKTLGGVLGMSAWLKQLLEYGIIGAFIFVCFSASCLRRSTCPGLLLAAMIFHDLVTGSFFTPWAAIITIALCTSHERALRSGRLIRQPSTQAVFATRTTSLLMNGRR